MVTTNTNTQKPVSNLQQIAQQKSSWALKYNSKTGIREPNQWSATPAANTGTSPITPAPITPTPIKAPVATSPISKDSAVYKEMISKWYTDQGITDAYASVKSTKTPEQQATLSKQDGTTQPAPVKQPKQEPVAPIQPTKQPEQPTDQKWVMVPLTVNEYQDNSTARQNDIIANLNNYKTTNPEYMKDLETFKTTFRVDPKIRTQSQIDSMLNWFNGYTKWLWFSNTPTSELVKKGISNTDLEWLKVNDPNKYTEVKAEMEKQKTYYNLKNELYETETPKTIMQKIEEPIGSNKFFDDYKTAINSEEVKGLQTEMSDKEWQMKQLKLDLATIKKDVEKAYEGSGATKSKINAIIADQQTEINNKISALGIDYQTAVDKYNSIVKTAKDTMDMWIAQRNMELADRNQRMNELGFYYKYDPVGMTEMANTEFEIKNPDIDSPDANTARRALNTELAKYYEKYWDIIIRPQSQALNDIIAQSKAEWLSLSQALKKNFTDPLQEKSLYGASLQKNLWLDFDDYKLEQWEDGNWNIKNTSVSSWINTGWYNTNAGWTQNTITNMWSATDAWVDYDIGMWDEIQAPVSWTLSLQQDNATGNVSAKITQSNWDTVQINHLDKSTLSKLASLNWKKISAGTVIWYWGNTGNVKDINGNWLRRDWVVYNQQALDSWTGSHLDVRVKSGWKQLFGQDLVSYLNWGRWYSDSQKNIMENIDLKSITKIEQELLKKNGLSETDVYNYMSAKKNWVSNYEKALANITVWLTKDAKSTVVEQMSEYVANWDLENAKTLLVNTLQETLKWDDKSKFSFLNNTIDTVNSLKESYDRFVSLGWDTWLFVGSAEKVASKVGKVKDPTLRQLATEMSMALQQYRLNVSGAAFSVQEAAEYASLFPTIWDYKELTDAKINWLISSLTKNQNKFLWKKLWQTNYNNIFWSEQVSETPTKTPSIKRDSTPTIWTNFWFLDTIF